MSRQVSGRKRMRRRIREEGAPVRRRRISAPQFVDDVDDEKKIDRGRVLDQDSRDHLEKHFIEYAFGIIGAHQDGLVSTSQLNLAKFAAGRLVNNALIPQILVDQMGKLPSVNIEGRMVSPLPDFLVFI